MLTLEECKKRFNSQYKNLKIMEIVDLDKSNYVFTAVEKPSDIDYGDPFYKINKINGSISLYSPINDLDNWYEASYKRSIS